MKRLASLALASILSACGGGSGSTSGSSSPVSTTATDLTLSGTAATGKAIAGATVNAKCQAGAGSATTIADGTYKLIVIGGKLPCVLEITNPADGTKLHTVATGSSSTATANITPLTEMLTARVLSKDPAVFFAAFDPAMATSILTTVSIKAAQTDVSTVLSGTVDTSSLADFIATPLKAATPDNLTGGDAHDKILDALRAKLNSAQVAQVVTAFANTKTTADILRVVNNIEATPPTANAGVDQSVVAGTVITLDGSTSTVDIHQTLTYAWVLTAKPAGSLAILSSSTSAKPTFTADIAGTYVAALVVNSGTVNSGADAVSIVANVANSAPVANAGVAQNVVTGTIVTLDGSTSSDANSDPLTYAWTLTSKPAGSTAALWSTTSAKPTFTADKTGTYVASLVVNDGKVNSSNVGTVSITAAVLNVAPMANAGGAQNVVSGTLVTLDGSTSSDANSDPLTYAWTLTAKPVGSSANLSSSTSAKPTFSTDIAGTYVASLVVNDGKVNSSVATVSITVSAGNAAPIANAGAAQRAVIAAVVNLDGSVSSDANGDQLTYAWTLTSTPMGSSATLSSISAVKPSFTADMAGTYVATLIVSDGKVSSLPATTTITAVPRIVGAMGISQSVEYNFCGMTSQISTLSQGAVSTWNVSNCAVFGTAGSRLFTRIQNNGSASLKLTQIYIFSSLFGRTFGIDTSSQTISPGATVDFALPLWLGMEVTNATATFILEGEPALIVPLTGSMTLP